MNQQPSCNMKETELQTILSQTEVHNRDLYDLRCRLTSLLERLRGAHPAAGSVDDKRPEVAGLIHCINQELSDTAVHTGALAADIDELINLL